MKTSISLVVAFILSFVVSARAETVKVDSAKVEFVAPTGWKTAAKGTGREGIIVTLSPDEEASIIFAVADSDNLDKAIKTLDALLAKFVTDAKTAKAGKVTINGMKGIAAKGDAKVNAVAVKTGVLLLQTKSGQILFVIGLVNATKEAAYKKTFDEVIKGIKPI